MRRSVAAAALLLAVSTAAAGVDDRWIHIRVEDPRQGETVNVNVPLSLVEEVLPLVNSDDLRAGRVRITRGEHTDLDFRALWNAVRKTPDAPFVTVKSNDADVKVSKSGGLFLVDVRGRTPDQENVTVRVPVEVVDALFTDSPDELDVLAAVRALGARGNGDLVTVDGNRGEHVRIWIDALPSHE